MRDRSYDVSIEFLASFFRDVTEHAVELRSLSNDRSGPPKPLFTRDPEMIEAHCRRFDAPDRGMYFGICTRTLGASQGRRADLAECRALWADIDCLKDGIDKAEAIAAVKTLPIPPSIIIDSGGGLHLYWLLIETIDVRAGQDDAEDAIVSALRQLAGVVAGDPVVCELARVMRVPGTMNGKRPGDPAQVSVVEASWKAYDFDEIVSWLDWQRPVLRAPTILTEAATNPFLAASLRAGFKPPLDVERALEAMAYLGAGDTSIHQTQLRVSAALVHAGRPEDEIVAMLLEATRAAAGEHAKAWNWRREEASIRAMTVGAKAKFGVREAAPVVNLAEERAERAKANGTTGTAPPAAAAGKKKRTNETAVIGEAVIEWWRRERGPLANVKGELATYAGGFWKVFGEAEQNDLRVAIQGVMAAQDVEPKTGILGSVWRYVVERPEILRHADWDQTGLIVCRNGAIDPRTGKTYPHSPEHYATWRIEADIDLKATCPRFEAFLADAMQDVEPAEARRAVETLQEHLGASLVRGKPRDLRKALFAIGKSRSGKTRVANIYRAIFGGAARCTGVKVMDLEDTFGMQSFVNKAAWIADDAVSLGQFMDSERFKVIVTGEPISIRRMHRDHLHVALDVPVVITANHLPRVRDDSDAVYNRALIFPMNRQWPEGHSAGREIDQIVIEEELFGVVLWAINGWLRLRERGRYDPPAIMLKAISDFQASNSPIRTWIAQCVELNAWSMVDYRDLVSSFNGWLEMAYGGEAKRAGGQAVIRALKAEFPNSGSHKIMGYGLLTGVKLNEDGIAGLKAAQDAAGPGRSIGSGKPEAEVNRSWNGPKASGPSGKEPRF